MAVKHLIGRRGIGFNPGSVKFIITSGLTPNPLSVSITWTLAAQNRTWTLPRDQHQWELASQNRTWTLPNRNG